MDCECTSYIKGNTVQYKENIVNKINNENLAPGQWGPMALILIQKKLSSRTPGLWVTYTEYESGSRMQVREKGETKLDKIR